MVENQERPDLLDRLGEWLNPALILAALACCFVLWQWWNTHSELRVLRIDVAQQLTSAANAAQEARTISRQTADNTRDMSQRIADLEARVAASQSQQMALQSLYRTMAESRDDWTLADIEQVILSANQQLQINGNIKAAIIALQDADARLQSLNRPQFTLLRNALNRDIALLQAQPQVDTVGLTAQLDILISQIDTLPLADEHEIPATQPKKLALAHPVPVTRAQRFALELWQQLQGLVQVRRIDTPDTALLLPEQSYFLRQNLKLRLLSARIALFAHDENSYQSDLSAARSWLQRYFNTRDSRTVAALDTLNSLMHSTVSLHVPSLQASLDALQASHLDTAH